MSIYGVLCTVCMMSYLLCGISSLHPLTEDHMIQYHIEEVNVYYVLMNKLLNFVKLGVVCAG